MPVLGLGLHFLVAIFFAVHAVRSGQERYWLLALFMFPLLGSFVYALAVWLPEMRQSRGGRRLVRGLRETLDPGRELREAQHEFEHSATIANRVRVADALHANERHADAVNAYREALRGVHSDDADIQVKLARALLDNAQAAEARELLETLIAGRPDFKSPEGHLIYARAVAASGDRDKARAEFETLIGYFAGMEARARYVEILTAWGETETAQRLADESLRHARHLPAYSRRLNDAWIRRLKQIPGGAPNSP
jgi:hypothetical protein